MWQELLVPFSGNPTQLKMWEFRRLSESFEPDGLLEGWIQCGPI